MRVAIDESHMSGDHARSLIRITARVERVLKPVSDDRVTNFAVARPCTDVETNERSQNRHTVDHHTTRVLDDDPTRAVVILLVIDVRVDRQTSDRDIRDASIPFTADKDHVHLALCGSFSARTAGGTGSKLDRCAVPGKIDVTRSNEDRSTYDVRSITAREENGSPAGGCDLVDRALDRRQAIRLSVGDSAKITNVNAKASRRFLSEKRSREKPLER